VWYYTVDTSSIVTDKTMNALLQNSGTTFFGKADTVLKYIVKVINFREKFIIKMDVEKIPFFKKQQ
jgi:hypothetical protein